MHFNTIAAVSMLAMQANAKTVTVAVGKDGLAFTPSNIKAEKGDTLEFRFYPNMHDVVVGDGKKPCNPLGNNAGFFSGAMKVSSKEGGPKVFRTTVDSTDPIYLYCSIGQHCQGGMVAVVNPKSDKDVSDFKSSAAEAAKNVSPGDTAYGGTVADAGSSSSPSGSGSQTSGAASTPAASSSSKHHSGSGSQTSTPTTPEASVTSGGATTPTAGGGSNTASTTKPTSTGAAGSVQVQFGGAIAAAAGLAAFIL